MVQVNREVLTSIQGLSEMKVMTLHCVSTDGMSVHMPGQNDLAGPFMIMKLPPALRDLFRAEIPPRCGHCGWGLASELVNHGIISPSWYVL